VAVIIVLLIVVPSHHASFSYVFTSRSFGSFSHGMYWFYVLPLGFLLTMYTITGYDASAHVSEETHDAALSAPKGVWRSCSTRR
jgi:amino acid transporter